MGRRKLPRKRRRRRRRRKMVMRRTQQPLERALRQRRLRPVPEKTRRLKKRRIERRVPGDWDWAWDWVGDRSHRRKFPKERRRDLLGPLIDSGGLPHDQSLRQAPLVGLPVVPTLCLG